MSTTPPDPDDDQHWLDMLAGRHVAEPDRRTAQEATWLRAALLAYRAQAPVGSPAAPQDRIGRLIARARAAGLTTVATQERTSQECGLLLRRPRLRWPLGAAALAATLALTLVPWALQHRVDNDDGAVLRGEAVQTRHAADPLAEREALRAALQAAGLKSAPYQRLDRLGLDVDLPQPLTPAGRSALQSWGLTPPSGPTLRIEFIAAGVSR